MVKEDPLHALSRKETVASHQQQWEVWKEAERKRHTPIKTDYGKGTPQKTSPPRVANLSPTRSVVNRTTPQKEPPKITTPRKVPPKRTPVAPRTVPPKTTPVARTVPPKKTPVARKVPPKTTPVTRTVSPKKTPVARKVPPPKAIATPPPKAATPPPKDVVEEELVDNTETNLDNVMKEFEGMDYSAEAAAETILDDDDLDDDLDDVLGDEGEEEASDKAMEVETTAAAEEEPASREIAVAPKPISKKIAVPDNEEALLLFDQIDENSSGKLSLAELDKAITIMYPELNQKAAIMRAYKATDTSGDGFVSRNEFCFFLSYMIFYHNLWGLFEVIDHDDDHRISRDEFLQVAPRLKELDGDASAVFDKIDADCGGMILFVELCQYMANSQLDVDALQDEIENGSPPEAKTEATVVKETPLQ